MLLKLRGRTGRRICRCRGLVNMLIEGCPRGKWGYGGPFQSNRCGTGAGRDDKAPEKAGGEVAFLSVIEMPREPWLACCLVVVAATCSGVRRRCCGCRRRLGKQLGPHSPRSGWGGRLCGLHQFFSFFRISGGFSLTVSQSTGSLHHSLTVLEPHRIASIVEGRCNNLLIVRRALRSSLLRSVRLGHFFTASEPRGLNTGEGKS